MKSMITDKNLYRQKAKELVAQMTLSEKAGLCSGSDCWNLKELERLGLPSITMMDGPHGLRKQIGVTDNLGIGDSVPSVCFPTASALACSFDRELACSVGRAMGEECVQEEVAVILGPGVNQKRSPLCGRNFEYFSEDPILSGELAASMIQGIQSTGTGASLKHFAVNNQEKRRMSVNAVVDERTLRETYLRAFEIAVKKGKPYTVMCSYNRLNGTYCSENKYLMTDILREEWGFDGVVVSDWGAVHDRVLGIKAGLDIEMPGNQGFNDRKLVAAIVKTGPSKGHLSQTTENQKPSLEGLSPTTENQKLSLEDLNRAAERVSELILRSMSEKKTDGGCDLEKHHQLAIRAAEQSSVLLKNDENLLPGNKNQKAAVIGAFAKTPRYQGAGSSKINPIKIETPWDAFMESGLNAEYSPGYSLLWNKSKGSFLKQTQIKEGANKRSKENTFRQSEQDAFIQNACAAAAGKDIVYLFAGLPEGYESEGFDRTDMHLPEEQNRLIEAVSACNPNVVVILMGGAPMELPWIGKVKSVLLAYLGGEGVGKAVVNLLLGIEVPCGKLAETWPLKLEDCPSYHYFPGGRLTVEHRESIYVGYRYYEKAERPVLFPFGHGLSYVDFTYSNLETDRKTCRFGEMLNLTFSVTNQGNRAARETVLIFAVHENEVVFLPKKELKEFVKIHLNPGETKQISIALDTAVFGYYNTLIKDWYAPSGTYQILIGPSSKGCPLTAEIHMRSPNLPQPDLRQRAPSYYRLPKNEMIIPTQEFEALYGRTLPIGDNRVSRPYTMEHTIEDIRHTAIGKIMNWYADRLAREAARAEEGQEGMMAATFKEMPFFSIVASDEKIISERMMEGILDLLNGHNIRGLWKLLNKE
ncbi:glycoside hydrolase family 3 C-terminal domain-containing protein [Anoxybacterium hadale]|uniref:glycoside hydrolase family 3 C-terminal domain-containing protein n=1 Tax=Anoxybacterium hadale TaxID=3408580 RepID=UPI003B00BCC9